MAKIVVLGSVASSLVGFRGHLLSELVAAGHEVIACAPEESASVSASLEKIGVEFKPVIIDRAGMNPLKDMRTLVGLIRLFKRLKPDIFLGYTIKPVLYGSIAAKQAGVKQIFSMITGLGYSFSGTSRRSKAVGLIVRTLYKTVLRFNNGVIFQNPDDLALMFELGLLRDPAKAYLVNGSGVDVEQFSPVAFPSEVSFLLIARLLRDKGIYEYVLAAQQVRLKYPNMRFRLVGMLDPNPLGISSEEIESWVTSGFIEFLGSKDDVRPAIADCTVYVLPSYREGTPRTVLEAMAMGRPIITTDAPGCRETVQHGVNGHLVKVRDVQSLSESMEWFIVNKDAIKVMGEKSRAIALKKYDVRKVSPTVIKAMGLDPADHRLPKKNSGPKRLRIVVLGSMADSLVRFRGHLLKSLVDMGHEVYACAPDENETISKRLMALGVRYRKIILERTGVNPFADLRTIINLYREFRRISPDIFLGYTIKPVIYGSIAAKLSGIDHIHSMITGLGYAFSETGRRSRIVGALVRGLYKLILSYNECVFFQNPDDRQLFVDRRLVHESQVRLINGSGVDISEFSPKPFPQQVSFLLIARLIRDKGIVEFVSAAKILKARHPKARFRLVGVFDKNPSAISRDEVDQWVSAGYIEFLGYLDDVRPAIADSSVFVLPTFYREGTPRTVLEAMAMGRPIVTTDAPGCRETVEEGKNGFLVPVHNIDSLVNAMEKFLVQPELVYKFGKVSRQIALVKYDVRNVTRDIIDGIGVRSTGTAQQENQEAKAI